MAGEDKKTVVSSFMAKVLQYVPEAQKAGAQALIDSLVGNEQAVGALAEDVMMRSDYSRAMNALKATEAELTAWRASLGTWKEEKDAEFAEREAALTRQPAPVPTPTPTPTPTLPANVVTREDLNKLFDEFGRGGAAAIAVASTLTARHMKEFGEVLDVATLMRDPKINEIGLQGVYEATFKDRYAEKASAAEKARIDKLVEERVAEERKKFASTSPYPVGQPQPSPLDGLKAPDPNAPPVDLAEAAAAEYQRLQAARLGG